MLIHTRKMSQFTILNIKYNALWSLCSSCFAQIWPPVSLYTLSVIYMLWCSCVLDLPSLLLLWYLRCISSIFLPSLAILDSVLEFFLCSSDLCVYCGFAPAWGFEIVTLPRSVFEEHSHGWIFTKLSVAWRVVLWDKLNTPKVNMDQGC